MQAYSDSERESDPTALPDLEVWHYQHKQGDDQPANSGR